MPVKIYRQGLLKKADETLTFEQQMGTMTSARINEKLGVIAPYAIGFELLKKDEDGTKGVGTMVYLIGDQVVYIPSFFNQGRLRTCDMVILADKQQFMPATEGIITYLRSKYDREVGEIIQKDQPQVLQGMPSSITVRDNITPIRKTSSYSLTKNFHKTAEYIMDLDRVRSSIDTDVNVLDVALGMGKQAAMNMVELLTGDTKLFDAFNGYYGAEKLGLFKEAATKLLTPVEKAPDTILVEPFTKQAQDMTEKEQKLMDTFGFLVKTARNDFSNVERESTLVDAFTTVTESGFYDVMTLGGELKKALVIKADSLDKYEDGGTLYGSVFNRNTVHQSFLHPSYGIMRQTAKYAYLLEDTPNGAYLWHEGPLMGRKYDMPTEKVTEAVIAGGNPLKEGQILQRSTLIVCPDTTAIILDERYLPVDGGGWYSEYEWTPFIAITVSDTVKKPHESKKMLILPEGCIVFKEIDSWLREDSRSEDKDAARTKYKVKLAGSPGFQQLLDKYLSYRYSRVKIYSNGTGFAISDNTTEKAPQELSVKEASFRLVRDYNVSPEEAPNMVLSAYPSDGVSNSSVYYCIEKKAAGGDYSRGASPYDIPREMSYHEVEYDGPQVERVASEGLIPAPGMTPQQLMDAVQKAADKGVKEVFDVTLMKSLVNTTRPDVLMGDYFTTMLKMMDKLCRMLFLAYAKEDDFRDEFGTDKYDEFVETVRNAMQDMAELFLFVSTRAVTVDGMEILGDDTLLDGSAHI